MRELDEEIHEIKKEIIESRGLAIKTNNLTSSLAADVKGIAKRQLSYERRMLWNSAAAYVLFALLSFLGLKLATDARVESIATEHQGLRVEVERLRRDLETERRRGEERRATDEKAAAFHQLARQSKRREALEAYDAVRGLPLTPVESAVFAEAVARFKVDLAATDLQLGQERLRAGRAAEALELFRRSLELTEGGPAAAGARYQAAMALRALRRCDEAIGYFEAALAQDADRDLHDDAAYSLGQCHADAGRYEQARTAWQGLLRRWPRSEHVPAVRAGLRALWIAQARARALGQAATASPPGAESGPPGP